MCKDLGNKHWTKNQISYCLYLQETWMTRRPKFPIYVSCMTHGISFMFPL